MYDFIIVGARCAGASLACFLGAIGYKVLLIDKYSSPGPTLSTHLIGETDIYDRLGIRERMERAGAPALTRMRVDWEGCLFESDLYVTSRVLGLRRELLDNYLLEAVRKQPNVTVMLNTKVIHVNRTEGRVSGVACRDRHGSVFTYSANAVIGADGVRSAVAESVGASKLLCSNEQHLAVLYAYFSHVVPLPIPAVEWYWHSNRIVLCNPIDQNLHCIAMMVPVEESASWNDKQLSESFKQQLMEIRTLSPRIRDCKIAGRTKGVRRLESFIRQSFGDGWVLVGDAGAHLHPVSGVGIDNAVCSSEYLANELHCYMQKQKTWHEAMTDYVRQRDERIRPQYDAYLKTLSRTTTALDGDSKQGLNMLCTFPGLVKQLGGRIQEVLAILK